VTLQTIADALGISRTTVSNAYNRPDQLALELRRKVLERTRAMNGSLEVANSCGCETPAECALFPVPGDEPAATDVALTLIHVKGGDCRREPA
jgi:hypothetical protein